MLIIKDKFVQRPNHLTFNLLHFPTRVRYKQIIQSIIHLNSAKNACVTRLRTFLKIQLFKCILPIQIFLCILQKCERNIRVRTKANFHGVWIIKEVFWSLPKKNGPWIKRGTMVDCKQLSIVENSIWYFQKRKSVAEYHSFPIKTSIDFEGSRRLVYYVMLSVTVCISLRR